MSRLADRSLKQRGRGKCARGKEVVFRHEPYHRNVADGELLADLRRAAKLAGRETITSGVYARFGSFGRKTISGRFGSWNGALKAAGMGPSRNFNVKAAELTRDIRRVAREVRSST